MILVLETNGGLLHLFSSAAEIESELEVIDVENHEYEICDDTGQRFVAEIIIPITMFGAGRFHLKQNGIPDKAVVASFLSRTRSLNRCCDGIKSLEDLWRLHNV